MQNYIIFWAFRFLILKLSKQAIGQCNTWDPQTLDRQNHKKAPWTFKVQQKFKKNKTTPNCDTQKVIQIHKIK